MISIMAWRAASEGPIGFSLASMWMPLLGSANLIWAARARCASVRMGTVASAEAPAAKRKNERRETPLQTAEAVILEMGADDICVNSSEGWVGNSNAAWGQMLRRRLGMNR